MKNTIILALCLVALTSQAQSQRADTLGMVVMSTARNFTLSTADFGGTISETLIGDMVRSYDTVIVLKNHDKVDSSGRKPLRYIEERRCDKISGDIKDKIVVIDFNKSCDVTQMCLNAQRGGAKALIIIHEGNEKKGIKLAKKGMYMDSIKIPVFTVPNNEGEKITQLLPSTVGIVVPVSQTQSRMSSTALNLEAQAELDKSRIDWESNTGGQTDYFVVEKLNTQTGQFTPLETFNSSKQAGLEQLSTYDPKPEEGDNNYRIKSVQLDGSVVYSEVKTVNFNKLNDIKIFPNPTEDEINISLKGYANKNIDFTLYDMQGKPIHTEHIDALQSNIYTITLKQKTTSGQYMLRIKAQGKRDVIKMVTIKQ
jgi:hypothetical protein